MSELEMKERTEKFQTTALLKVAQGSEKTGGLRYQDTYTLIKTHQL